MSPFEALARFAFVDDRSGLGTLTVCLEQLVGARPDGDDQVQVAMISLARSRERAFEIVRRLGERNAALRAEIGAAGPGSMPVLSSVVLESANGQLVRYAQRLLRNARISEWRSRRNIVEVEYDEQLAPPNATSDQQGVLAARDVVLRAVAADPLRPGWLDEALSQLEDLAFGAVSMEQLTQACVRGDPALGALTEDAARRRATNRIQKTHERARTHLLLETDRLVGVGVLDEEGGRMAKEWVALLKRRRQNSRASASGGEHE